jgi:hypothetical protein
VRLTSLDLTDAEISVCLHLCEQAARTTGQETYRKVYDQLLAYYEDARHTNYVEEEWLTGRRLGISDRLYEVR